MKMKKILLMTFLGLILLSCDVDDERLQFLDNSENRAGAYYAWENSDTLKVVEGASGVVRVQSPWIISSASVNVVIEVTGSAMDEIGTEITLTNATTIRGESFNSIEVNGSTIMLTINNRDTLTSVPFDLQVEVDTDGITDGDKLLVFEITSVNQGGKVLSAGDNNGEFVKAIVKILDADCPSDFGGSYEAGNNCFATDASSPTITETAVNGVYNVTDFTAGYYAFVGVPNIPAVLKDACGSLSIDDFTARRVLNFENMSGTDNGDGTLSLTWTEASGLTNGGDPVTCTTIFTLN